MAPPACWPSERRNVAPFGMRAGLKLGAAWVLAPYAPEVMPLLGGTAISKIWPNPSPSASEHGEVWQMRKLRKRIWNPSWRNCNPSTKMSSGRDGRPIHPTHIWYYYCVIRWG